MADRGPTSAEKAYYILKTFLHFSTELIVSSLLPSYLTLYIWIVDKEILSYLEAYWPIVVYSSFQLICNPLFKYATREEDHPNLNRNTIIAATIISSCCIAAIGAINQSGWMLNLILLIICGMCHSFILNRLKYVLRTHQSIEHYMYKFMLNLSRSITMCCTPLLISILLLYIGLYNTIYVISGLQGFIIVFVILGSRIPYFIVVNEEEAELEYLNVPQHQPVPQPDLLPQSFAVIVRREVRDRARKIYLPLKNIFTNDKVLIPFLLLKPAVEVCTFLVIALTPAVLKRIRFVHSPLEEVMLESIYPLCSLGIGWLISVMIYNLQFIRKTFKRTYGIIGYTVGLFIYLESILFWYDLEDAMNSWFRLSITFGSASALLEITKDDVFNVLIGKNPNPQMYSFYQYCTAILQIIFYLICHYLLQYFNITGIKIVQNIYIFVLAICILFGIVLTTKLVKITLRSIELQRSPSDENVQPGVEAVPRPAQEGIIAEEAV